MGFMMKRSGVWEEAAKVCKKVDGAWVEQTDLASVIPDNVRYRNGGEYVASVKTVTITGTGNASYCVVAIDGTRYYKAATVEVLSYTEIEIYIGNVPYASRCFIALNGEVVQQGTGTYYYTVDKNCEIKITAKGTSPLLYYEVEITTEG